MAIEQLEGRQLMAYSTLAGSYVVNASDVGAAQISDAAASDTQLIVTDMGGYYSHTGDGNTGVGAGQFASALDWDSATPGVQMLKVDPATTLTLDARDGLDATTIGSPAYPASLLSGSVILRNNGSSALFVDDSGSTSASTYSFNGLSIPLPGGATLGVTNPETGGVTIDGGSAGDVFNVTATTAGEPLFLSGGAGADTANIKADSSQVGVYLAGGANTVAIGNAHSMGAITQGVDVSATGGTATLTLDAAADTLPGPVVINAPALEVPGAVTGMAAGTVTYDATVTALNIDGPTVAGLTYNLQSSLAGTTTTIDGGVGTVTPARSNTFLIGTDDYQGMGNVLGPVVINGGGKDTLNLDDAGLDSDSPIAYTLDTGTFTRPGTFGGSPLAFNGVTAINLHAGDLSNDDDGGNNTLTVNNLGAGIDASFYSGTGTDAATVHATASGSTLHIHGGGGPDSVLVDGGSNIAGNVYVDNSAGLTDLTVRTYNGGASGDSTLVGDGTTSTFAGTTAGNVYFTTAQVSKFHLLAFDYNYQNYVAQNLSIGFDGGNPIPVNGVDFQTSGGTLALHGQLPSGRFWYETSTPSGYNTGEITLEAPFGPTTTVDYSGVYRVNDTASVGSYVYLDKIAPDSTFMIVDGAVIAGDQTAMIESGALNPGFVPTQFANKNYVTFNTAADAGLQTGLSTSPAYSMVDYNGAIDLPTTPAQLNNLTINTQSGGNDLIQVPAAPPGVSTSINTQSGADTVNFSAASLAPGTNVYLDGGTGLNTLNFDAGGHTISSYSGYYPGEVVIVLDNGATINAANFPSINVSGLPATPPVPWGPSNPIPVNGVENAPIVDAEVGGFTSDAPGAKAADFTATIDWGDGSTSAGVIVQYTDSPRDFSILGSHTYREAGNFTITEQVRSTGSILSGPYQQFGDLVVSPNGQSQPPATFPITWTTITGPSNSGEYVTSANVRVADAPISLTVNPIAAVEGQPTSTLVLASFTDMGGIDPNGPDPATRYTAVVDWGDGTGPMTLPPGSIAQVSDTNSFQVGASHDYAQDGAYVVTVTVSDGGFIPTVVIPNNEGPLPATATATAMVTVIDAPLAPLGGVPLSAVSGQKFPSAQVAVFIDANPQATLNDFAATIDWGDGSPIGTGAISQPGGVGTPFVVTSSGYHIYTDVGSYPVVVSVKDDGGKHLTIGTTATVTPATLSAPAGINLATGEGKALTNVPVATFVDGSRTGTAGDFAATIDWGDGSTPTTGLVTKVGGTAAGPLYSVAGSHTYATQGTFALSVTIADLNLGATLATSVATVTDAPLAAQGATFTGVEGNSTGGVLLATFSDSGGALPASSYAASVNWGDGTFSSPTITPTGAADGVSFLVSGGHTYAHPGTYQVIVTVQDPNGSHALANSRAVIGDAALTPAAIQPAMSMTEGKPFYGQIAAFNDANPASIPADFAATIDWGDGTSLVLGTVSQPGGPGSTFIVAATHTYADSGVNGATGHFPILVNMVDTGGARASIAGTAAVADVSINFGGQLDPASDHGPSNSDGITNVNQPTFFGISEGNAVVKIYSQPSGGGPYTAIGQVQADAAGAWRITSAMLADGSYNIIATTLDAAGNTSASAMLLPNANEGPLVIDTAAPMVSGVMFDPSTGRFLMSFQDDRSGMDTYSIVDASNFSLAGAGGASAGALLVQNATGPQGVSPTYPQTVAINMGGNMVPAGTYQITAFAASAAHNSGITDLAGNALDGQFYGNLPSGNGHPGGDFTITLPTTYNTPTPAAAVVVPAAVGSPQGGATTGKHHVVPHTKPARVAHHHAVHDAALALVKVPRKGH